MRFEFIISNNKKNNEKSTPKNMPVFLCVCLCVAQQLQSVLILFAHLRSDEFRMQSSWCEL